MKFFKILFKNNEKLDIKKESSLKEVHRQNNKITPELLKAHVSAKKLKKETEKMLEALDTAMAIARASGGRERGL